MNDDPLDIDALHVIVGDLQTCASMLKELGSRIARMRYAISRTGCRNTSPSYAG